MPVMIFFFALFSASRGRTMLGDCAYQEVGQEPYLLNLTPSRNYHRREAKEQASRDMEKQKRNA